MARFDTFEFVIRGQGGHAAMPQQLRDPFVAAGQLISSIQSVVARNIDPFDQGVVSLTFVRGGNVHNVVPDVIEIGGSARSFDEAVQDKIECRLKAIAQGLGSALDVSIDISYDRRIPATVNSSREADLAQRAARNAIGDELVDTRFRPSMGSEDFSWMLAERPGAFAFIGAGPLVPGKGLHQASYDFNDRLLGIGAAYYAAIVSEELPII